jgi:hypothetical protein
MFFELDAVEIVLLAYTLTSRSKREREKFREPRIRQDKATTADTLTALYAFPSSPVSSKQNKGKQTG